MEEDPEINTRLRNPEKSDVDKIKPVLYKVLISENAIDRKIIK